MINIQVQITMFLFQSSDEKAIRETVEKHLEICLRNSDDKYEKSMQVLSKHIQNNNQKAIESVVDSIKATIKDDQYQPVRKYQAIKLLRDLMKIQIRNKNKALGKYVVKKILKRLTILAAHRAGDPDEERGRDLFKNVKKGQEKYSVKFLNELLLSIQQWAKTWPGVSEGTKKQFHEAYNELVLSNVQFPKQSIKIEQFKPTHKQDGLMNSKAAYNSVPKRQSRTIETKKQQIKNPGSFIGPNSRKKSGGLDEKLVKEHFSVIRNLLELLIQTLQGCVKLDEEELAFIKEIVLQFPQIVAKGDAIVAQISPDQMENNFYVKKIQQTFEFQKSISKNIKIAERKISQFPVFKKKYINSSTQLIKSLSETPPPNKRTSLSIDITKKPQKLNPDDQTPSESAIKRLSVPKLRPSNLYSSTTGRPDDWVIKEKSQYNSNTHKEEKDAVKQFGSFGIEGIGGIGEKVKNQTSKQPSKFAPQNQTERVRHSQNEEETQARPIPRSEKTIKQNQTKQVKQNDQKRLDYQSQNQKQQQKSVFQLDEPSPHFQERDQKRPMEEPQLKQITQKSNYFEDSDFLKEAKQAKPDINEDSTDFFGQFQENDAEQNKMHNVNRNPRRKKTGANTKKDIEEGRDNPFDNGFDSQGKIGDNNLSAFSKKESGIQGSKNPFSAEGSESWIGRRNSDPKRDSLQLKPSRDSLYLKPSQSSNRYGQQLSKNEVPNFWEKEQSQGHSVSNPFQEYEEKKSQCSKRSINPFEDGTLSEFGKKSNLSKNPFEEDGRSQYSKSKQSVKKVELDGQSKLQQQNPFETRNDFMRKKSNTYQNPFTEDAQSVSRKSGITNPFQTSEHQFKPVSTAKYDSLSQRQSFKEMSKVQVADKNISMQNPFQINSNQKPEITQKQKPPFDDTWQLAANTLEPKSQNQKSGFDFDAFEDVQKPSQNLQLSQKKINQFGDSNQLSRPSDNRMGNNRSFENPFQKTSSNNTSQTPSGPEKNSGFSDFQPAKQQNLENVKESLAVQIVRRQPTQQSIGFDDFQNVGNGNPADQKSDGFSHFQPSQDYQKESQKSNFFEGFDVSRDKASEQKIKNNQIFKQSPIKPVQVAGNKIQYDQKSGHSGFSGFNLNANNEKEGDRSGFSWSQFDKFGAKSIDSRQFKKEQNYHRAARQQGNSQQNIHTERFDQKSNLKLNLQQNFVGSQYHSPYFNNEPDSKYINTQFTNERHNSGREQLEQLAARQKQKREESLSIKFEEFQPVEKKGYPWHPLGKVGQGLRGPNMYTVSDYDLQLKKSQLKHWKEVFQQQKILMAKAKKVQDQARKTYMNQTTKIDQLVQQKQSYTKILTSLSESNQAKEDEIDGLTQRINKLQEIKEKILLKEKLLFQKTKQEGEVQLQIAQKQRGMHNKWEVFNRNLKLMRERQVELVKGGVSSSKTYSQSYRRA